MLDVLLEVPRDERLAGAFAAALFAAPFPVAVFLLPLDFFTCLPATAALSRSDRLE